ncbi:MAG: hypothetical protein ACXAD7_00930 [Candidatus Kariarchaeaceae archaeon]|jgi:hypothetical protein
MDSLNSFDKWISSKQWDYQRFLQLITLTLVINLLIFFIWILSLSYSGLIEEEVFRETLKELGIGLLLGTIAGLIIGFLEVINKYLRKEWDLHRVVPYFLVLHLISLVCVILILYFTSIPAIQKNGIGIGYAIGGLMVILAYTGEVKKEHTEETTI